MTFSNPIVGGVGKLIRDFIRSPNFVTGVSGWTINRDGSVEFNFGTFRGTIILSPSGSPALLIYDGTPAAGNLILSISGFDGTDSFANKFWAGLSFIHGTSPSGSRGRISFGINDVNVNDSGMILSYVDAFLNPHLIIEGPGNGISLDLGVHNAFLGGPNGNQIEVDDTGNAIFLTSLGSMQLQASGTGIQLGGTGADPFFDIIKDSFTVSFAGVAGVNGTRSYKNGAFSFPVGSVPQINPTLLVGANNDCAFNLQATPTNTGFNWRVFQCRNVAITTTITVFYQAIG